MEEFLKTVARHYYAKVTTQATAHGLPSTLPFSRYLFCFPNHRSGLFFARYLEQIHNEGRTVDGSEAMPCCVPPMTTISDLFGLFSHRQVIDRTALLFRLYKVYKEVRKLHSQAECETFDQFVFWGDLLLSDFNDVDLYLVNPDQLFANVRDLKEIDARFSELSDEQVAIIRSFWHSFRPENEYPKGEKHEVFAQTWAILAELYHKFRLELSQSNEAYSGMMQREVYEQLRAAEASDPFAALDYDKVVFVGLTAISEVDRRMMSLLKVHGRAEFCWDYADPRLQSQDTKATSAAYFARHNLKDFGNELEESELQSGLVPDAEREVKLYSVASGVGQARLARRVLKQFMTQDPDFDPLRTAVILPDEKLLLPMLYAMPGDAHAFNVTMGYGLRNTQISAFVNKLALLQQAYRAEGDTFYFRQVLPLLSHTYTIAKVGNSSAQYLAKRIVRENLYQVPVSMFADNPFLRKVFRHVTTAEETIDYLTDILQTLMSHTTDDVDYEFIYHYHKTMSALAVEVRRNGISYSPETFFQQLDKLIAGVSVPFSGEPLEGVQVMGVLETRSLDFDNVIILSMNEGVFPAKPSQNTFVPMSLRDAFGMPTQRHRDSVFAYHFYRLISRAKRLTMIYDSRAEGTQTGEESRYVKQLRYLMGYRDLKAQTVADDIGVVAPMTIEVPKTPEIMGLLSKCTGPDGELNISATALKSYIQCPLKFYLGFVRRLHEDKEVNEDLSSALFGDILHSAIQSLYAHHEGKMVEKETLQSWIDEPHIKVHPHVVKAFDEKAKIKVIAGYNRLLFDLIVSYIVSILQHDLDKCPFRYLAGERTQVYLFDTQKVKQVRIKCVYDRLDIVGDTLRIVDYKTGSSFGDKQSFPAVEDLFAPGSKGSLEAFQVMMYCLMLENASPEQLRDIKLTHRPALISPHLYFVRNFKSAANVNTGLTVGSRSEKVQVNDFKLYREQVLDGLTSLIDNIFDPNTPFTQCEDIQTCSHCPFTTLCNRNLKNSNG